MIDELRESLRSGTERGVSKIANTGKKRKKTARCKRWCGVVWHDAHTRDTRWRTRKASLTTRYDARAPLVRFRLDSIRLDSTRLGSARSSRRARAPLRSVWFGRWAAVRRSSNDERARRRRPDCYAGNRRKRVAADVRDSWTSQPVRVRPFGALTIVGRTRGVR